MNKQNMTPFWVLYRREISRFMKVAVQTVFAPIVSSALYLLIFGVSLGENINLQNGFSYLVFLIPGIITMSALNNSFQNTSSSIVVGKFGGELEDLRVAPLGISSIIWAMALGGLTRGLLVGFITFLVGEGFYFFNTGAFLAVMHPMLLILFLIFGCLTFSFLGIAVAFWANSFDQLSAISSFVLLPLIYLGGVFFSLSSLHSFWQTLSKFNPLLYFINGVRFGFLGFSDIDFRICLIVSVISLALFYIISYRILSKGGFQRW